MTSVVGGASRNNDWSVILAGGEGERTRSFIEEWLGHHRPKQYCAFVGRRSLFQHTVDRADRVTSASRRVIVAAESHRDEVSAQLRGRAPGTVVLQRCPEALTAIELDGVRWSDWGCPQRIRETLRAIDREETGVRRPGRRRREGFRANDGHVGRESAGGGGGP